MGKSEWLGDVCTIEREHVYIYRLAAGLKGGFHSKTNNHQKKTSHIRALRAREFSELFVNFFFL